MYNHSRTVRMVAQSVLRYVTDVLVVDDGSDTPVADELTGLAVTIITHKTNRGKGQAILTASEYAAKLGFDYMITIDADGQHYPDDIPRLLDAIQKDYGSLVIGVRDFETDDVPLSSKFGRSFGNFWVRMQTGFKVNDIQSGFRAYPVFLLRTASCMFHTYAFEDEIVVRALWSGIPVSEVPISVYYSKTERISHFNKLRDNIKITILNTILTIRSFIPWPHIQIQLNGLEFIKVSQPVKIVKEQLMLNDTPFKFSLACGLGVLLGAVPLIGCHTLAIIYTAAMLRLSKVVAVAASHLCMPPLVPAACIEIGYYLRFGKFLTFANIHSLRDASFLELGHMGIQRILDWLIGSLLFGPALALVVALAVYIFIWNVQKTVIWKNKYTHSV